MTLVLPATGPLKAITLAPWWPVLIILGDKSFETRHQQTKHRGFTLLHASTALRAGLPVGGRLTLGDYEVEHDDAGYLLRGGALQAPYRLHVGAIVGAANLVDSLPMVSTWPENDGRHLLVSPDRLALYRGHPHHEPHEPADVSAERPYGEYRPGRWAHLLEDPRRLRPIPARGQQPVPWTVPNDIADDVRRQLGATA